jgi:hypothetical protein
VLLLSPVKKNKFNNNNKRLIMSNIWSYCTGTFARRIISGTVATFIFGGGILGGVFKDAIQKTAARHWNHYFNPENIQFDNGYYVGDVREENGKRMPHGKGKIIYNNGGWYNGEFGFGKRNGKGKFQSADGSWYDGEWLNDNRHGTGKYQYASGDWYDGKWRNNKRHGYGQFYSVMYKRTDYGDYVDDKRSGNGVIKWDNGNKYEGSWQDNNLGVFKGSGIYYYANGTVEKGHWGDKKWEKEKVLESKIPVREDFKDGYYIGTLKDGKWDGKGEVYYKNGNWYKGDFRSAYKHGKGESYFADYKRTDKGDYFEGLRKGKGEVIWESGNRYKGTWNDCLLEGEKTLYSIEGEGTMYYANGKSEKGKWINNNWVKK